MELHLDSRFARTPAGGADRSNGAARAAQPLPEITAEMLDAAKARAHELRAEAMREIFTAAADLARSMVRRLLAGRRHSARTCAAEG